MRPTQMANEPMRETKAHASNDNNTVSGLQGGDELEVAGVSTAVRMGDDVTPEHEIRVGDEVGGEDRGAEH